VQPSKCQGVDRGEWLELFHQHRRLAPEVTTLHWTLAVFNIHCPTLYHTRAIEWQAVQSPRDGRIPLTFHDDSNILCQAQILFCYSVKFTQTNNNTDCLLGQVPSSESPQKVCWWVKMSSCISDHMKSRSFWLRRLDLEGLSLRSVLHMCNVWKATGHMRSRNTKVYLGGK
jgi:hypothetical protein